MQTTISVLSVWQNNNHVKTVPWTTPSVSWLPTVILHSRQIRSQTFQLVSRGTVEWVCHCLLLLYTGRCFSLRLSVCIVSDGKKLREEGKKRKATDRLDLLLYMYLPYFPINLLFIVCKCSWNLLFTCRLIHFAGRGSKYQLPLITACKYFRISAALFWGLVENKVELIWIYKVC